MSPSTRVPPPSCRGCFLGPACRRGWEGRCVGRAQNHVPGYLERAGGLEGEPWPLPRELGECDPMRAGTAGKGGWQQVRSPTAPPRTGSGAGPLRDGGFDPTPITQAHRPALGVQGAGGKSELVPEAPQPGKSYPPALRQHLSKVAQPGKGRQGSCPLYLQLEVLPVSRAWERRARRVGVRGVSGRSGALSSSAAHNYVIGSLNACYSSGSPSRQ